MKDACSVHDPVYIRAFGDAVRRLERSGELDRLCAVSFYSRRGWEQRIWPVVLAAAGPVNVDANGSPVEDA